VYISQISLPALRVQIPQVHGCKPFRTGRAFFFRRVHVILPLCCRYRIAVRACKKNSGRAKGNMIPEGSISISISTYISIKSYRGWSLRSVDLTMSNSIHFKSYQGCLLRFRILVYESEVHQASALSRRHVRIRTRLPTSVDKQNEF